MSIQNLNTKLFILGLLSVLAKRKQYSIEKLREYRKGKCRKRKLKREKIVSEGKKYLENYTSGRCF